MTEPSLMKKGDDGPPPATRVHNNQILATSMARNVVAMTARAMVAGATRTTAATAATVMTVAMTATAATSATMTPNGNEDKNEDGNGKNNDKSDDNSNINNRPGGERCQSRRGNCGGGHSRPLRDAAIALTGCLVRTRTRRIMLSFPGSREV